MQRDGSGQGEWQPSAAAEPRRGGRWLLPRLSECRRAWGSQARPLVSFHVFQLFDPAAVPPPAPLHALRSINTADSSPPTLIL